jgi:hypothetical protein
MQQRAVWTGLRVVRRSLQIVFSAQCFARPADELHCVAVEVVGWLDRRVCAVSKVLTQPLVGVLVGSALPRWARIAELDVELGERSGLLRSGLSTLTVATRRIEIDDIRESQNSVSEMAR